MQKVQERFIARVAEVDAYFELMTHAHETGANISSDDRDVGWPLDTDSERMLRALGFLVLYNLVESTISDGLNVIVSTIDGESVEYAKAAECIRSLWIKHRLGKKSDTTRIIREAHSLIDDALNKAFVCIDRKTVMKGGGNINTERIREIAAVVGFERSAGPQAERGSGSLDLVKEKRNALAHGHFSFLEGGRDYSEADMQRCKAEVICYLDAVLQNMAKYISAKAYLSN